MPNKQFNMEERKMKRSAIFMVIGIVSLAFLLMGFVGQSKKTIETNASLEKRIAALEAEIAELKAELQGSRGFQPAKKGGVTPIEGEVTSSSGGVSPKPKPLAWTEGTQGWDEDGTSIWTSNLAYKVGIGTATPGFNLDINGDIRITGGINDGTSFGAANNVLVADGAGGVQWSAAPGGSNAYIWNQYAAPQSPASWWIDGKGRADNSVVNDTALIGISTGDPSRGVYGESSPAAGSGVGVTGAGGYFGAAAWYEPSAGYIGGVLGTYYGEGVWGLADATYGGYTGVWGEGRNSGATGVCGSGNGIGLSYWGGAGVSGCSDDVGTFGYGDATSQSWGVYGLTAATDGAGVVGAGTSAGGGMWMQNSGVSGTSDAVGVYGYGSTTAGSNGMWARSDATDGRGLMAVGNAIDPPYTFGSGAGIEATGDVYGVVGFSEGAASYGVYGYALGTGSYGVRGRADDGQGVRGTSAAGGEGVYGYAGGVNETGIAGAGDAVASYYTLNTGSGGAFTGDNFGVAGYALATPSAVPPSEDTIVSAGYFDNINGNAFAYVAIDYFGVAYKIIGAGNMSTIMKTRAGNKVLFAPESPEPWFEDIGEGQLKNGTSGKILLDPKFLDCITVNAQHPLKVFVQLRDDCKGVYVKTYNDGFEVRELQGGTSNAAFSYRVIGSRKGNENLRFPQAPPRFAKRSTKTLEKNVMKPSLAKEIVVQKTSKKIGTKIKKSTTRKSENINLKRESLKGTEPLKKDMSK